MTIKEYLQQKRRTPQIQIITRPKRPLKVQAFTYEQYRKMVDKSPKPAINI